MSLIVIAHPFCILVFILRLLEGRKKSLPPKISDSLPKVVSDLVTVTLGRACFPKKALRFNLRKK